MISRRDLALVATLSAIASPALAKRGESRRAPTPDWLNRAPWTGIGDIQRPGGVIHYAEIACTAPTAPPIVLLHKLGGWLSDWRFVAPVLAQGRRVVAFDLPGHGGSEWSGEPPYVQTLAESAATIVAAMDELGIGRCDLLGTSLGGCVAVPLAGFWPDRVRRLALISCALGGPNGREELLRHDRDEDRHYDRDDIPLPRPAEALAMFGIIHREAISEEGNASRRQAGRWVRPSERGVGLADIRGMLSRVEAPTLLLYGDRGAAYRDLAKPAAAVLRHAEIRHVPDSGAFVIQDNPAEAARILTQFLS